MDDYILGIINNLILCDNIQIFMEINSDKCKIIKNVVANTRCCYIKDTFDKNMIKLIKDRKAININNLLDITDEKDKSIITKKFLEHINKINKEFNKKNKRKIIESVDQYMSTYNKNTNVIGCYPSTNEMQDISIDIDTDYIKNITNAIILYNIISNEDYNENALNTLKMLSSTNIVIIRSSLEVVDENLEEIEETDNNFSEHIYFFKDGFKVTEYFN